MSRICLCDCQDNTDIRACCLPSKWSSRYMKQVNNHKKFKVCRVRIASTLWLFGNDYEFNKLLDTIYYKTVIIRFCRSIGITNRKDQQEVIELYEQQERENNEIDDEDRTEISSLEDRLEQQSIELLQRTNTQTIIQRLDASIALLDNILSK